MKKRNTSPPARREIFVLTAGEKKIVAFVLLAFVLGLTTKHYRDMHPPLPAAAAKTPGKPSASPVTRSSRAPKRPVNPH